jgi:hypothetical protein
MIHETVQDQEEEEHLPDSLPESEDMEEEENRAAAEEEAIIDNGQQEQNLPEQSTNQKPEQNTTNQQPEQNTTNQQPEQTQPDDQEQDVMGRMPGQLPNQTEAAPTDYANVKWLAKEKNRGLLGTEVTCKSGTKVVKSKVISDHEPEEVLQDEVGKFGLNDFDFKNYEQDEVLSHLFLKLTFVNWRQKVELFNAAYKKSGFKGRLFTRQEFLVALGLLSASAEFSHNGKDLFKRGDQKKIDGDDKENCESLVSHPLKSG